MALVGARESLEQTLTLGLLRTYRKIEGLIRLQTIFEHYTGSLVMFGSVVYAVEDSLESRKGAVVTNTRCSRDRPTQIDTLWRVSAVTFPVQYVWCLANSFLKYTLFILDVPRLQLRILSGISTRTWERKIKSSERKACAM